MRKDHPVLGWLFPRRGNEVDDEGWRRTALSAFEGLRFLALAKCHPKSVRFDRQLTARSQELELGDQPSKRDAAELEKLASEFADWQRDALGVAIEKSESSTRELLAEWDEAIHAGDKVADAAKELARSFRFVSSESSLDELRSRLSKEMEALIHIVQERDRLAKESAERFEEIRQTALSQLSACQEWTDADPLTKLANRNSHEVFMRAELAAARYEQPRSLAYIAIDGLVSINEELGFRAGDMAIVAFGNELKNAVGPNGFVARIYGGCFVVNLPVPAVELRAKLNELAGRLQGFEFELGEDSRVLSFHFGVVEVDGLKGYDESMAHANMELKASIRRSRTLKAAS